MLQFSEAKEKEDQQALQLEEAKQREDQLKQKIEKLKGELEEEKENVKKAKAEMVQEIRNVEAEMTEASIKFQKNERTWKAEVERLKEELAAARDQGPKANIPR
jgi:predicted secreted Zn-dependent protease